MNQWEGEGHGREENGQVLDGQNDGEGNEREEAYENQREENDGGQLNEGNQITSPEQNEQSNNSDH